MDNCTQLELRVAEIAEAIAGDYPRIKEADALEKLYAIEMSYYGVHSANRSLHAFIQEIKNKFQISDSDITELARQYILQ